MKLDEQIHEAQMMEHMTQIHKDLTEQFNKLSSISQEQIEQRIDNENQKFNIIFE